MAHIKNPAMLQKTYVNIKIINGELDVDTSVPNMGTQNKSVANKEYVDNAKNDVLNNIENTKNELNQNIENVSGKVDSEIEKVNDKINEEVRIINNTFIDFHLELNGKINANRSAISNLQKDVEVLALANEGKTFYFATDTENKYVRQVPSNALPYAYLNKVGGMSYKSKNVFDISKMQNYYNITVNQESKTITIPANKNNAYTLETVSVLMPSLKVGDTLYMRAVNSNSEAYTLVYFNPAVTALNYYTGVGSNQSITVTQEILDSNIAFYNSSSSTNENVISDIIFSTEPITAYQDYWQGVRNTPVSEVVVRGKNQVNINDLLDTSKWVLNGFYYNYEINDLLPNTQYTISFAKNGYQNVTDNGIYVSVSNTPLENYGASNPLVHNNGDNLLSNLVSTTLNSSDDGKLYIQFYQATTERLREVFITNCPDIQVELGNARTKYTPYTEKTINLNDCIEQDIPGYGWGIDGFSNNNIDFEKGVYTQNVDRINLGTLSFSYIESVKYFWIRLTDRKIGLHNILCDSYPRDTSSEDKVIFGNTSDKEIYIKDLSFNGDIEALKQSLQGVYLYYELETPLEITLTAIFGEGNVPNNEIKVEGNGSIIAENEYKLNAPLEIDYQLKL